jgi:hypothetical protein
MASLCVPEHAGAAHRSERWWHIRLAILGLALEAFSANVVGPRAKPRVPSRLGGRLVGIATQLRSCTCDNSAACFLQNRVLERSSGPGEFNFVTLVEWPLRIFVSSSYLLNA